MNFLEAFSIFEMTTYHWLSASPLIIVALFAVMALCAAPFTSDRLVCGVMSLGFIGSLCALFAVMQLDLIVRDIGEGVFIFDGLFAGMSFLILAGGLLTCLNLSGFERERPLLREVYALVGFAVTGMLVFVGSRDLMMMFIGLELFSLAIYVATGMQRLAKASAEASLKYFMFSGAASAVLLYGITLLYGASGSLKIPEIAEALLAIASNGDWKGLPPLAVMGWLLVVIGLMFKLGIFPFHGWVADVYTGAPTPITGFMAALVKVATTGAFLRICLEGWPAGGLAVNYGHAMDVFRLMIAATFLFGACVGLMQNNLKRLLAYSSLVHGGYLFLGIFALAMGRDQATVLPVTSYVSFYAIMTLGVFALISLLQQDIYDESSEGPSLDALRGLSKRHPGIAFLLSLFLLSMAGLPPTVGFFGKLLVLKQALMAGEGTLALVAVVASIISMGFYLKPVVYMYMSEIHATEKTFTFSPAHVLAFSLCALAVVGLGFYPQILYQLFLG